MTAQQGHRYRFEGHDVMAMESGAIVRVREIVDGDVWLQLGSTELVHASQLKPLPMIYFANQVPS